MNSARIARDRLAVGDCGETNSNTANARGHRLFRHATVAAVKVAFDVRVVVAPEGVGPANEHPRRGYCACAQA